MSLLAADYITDETDRLAADYVPDETDGLAADYVPDETDGLAADDGTIYGIELLNANQQLGAAQESSLIIVNEALGKSSEIKLALGI